MGRIKVAVLDDYQGLAAPHFDRLDKTKFEVTIFRDTLCPYNHPQTSSDVKSELVGRLKPFKIICAMRERTPFPDELLQQLPELDLIVTTGLKNAGIDMNAAKRCGVRVCGAPGKGRSDAPSDAPHLTGPDSTTQHVIALILGIARNIAEDDSVVKQGGWQTTVATGLPGKTLGLLGLGRLGMNVAKIMKSAFGMKIISWSTNLTQEVADEKAKAAGFPIVDTDGTKTFRAVSKDELFERSDVVSVHTVLSERSKGIVSKSDLVKMKSSALFVNTSRGPLVVEEDLLEILQAGKIRGAALDVFDLEPLSQDSPWRTTEWGSHGKSHVLLSPHMGYVEEHAMAAWYEENVENIERWSNGQDLLHVLA